MSSRKLGQKMALVAHSWLHDPVRPHLQLSTLLEALSKHPKLTPQAVRAAQALQNNQAYKKYILLDAILKPASVPHHYERLIDGLEKSSQGIARPWWKVVLGIWR